MTQEAMNLKVLEPFMEKLDFVQWDRFTNGEGFVNCFGWINRPDGRSDFVLLAIWDGHEEPHFWTSSAQYSEEIARRLYGDAEGHVSCQRVEHAGLSLSNMVRLGDTPRRFRIHPSGLTAEVVPITVECEVWQLPDGKWLAYVVGTDHHHVGASREDVISQAKRQHVEDGDGSPKEGAQDATTPGSSPDLIA